MKIMKLAIVIPAFKGEYFEKTLYSIANQTNKNFTLYIGDDASRYNLYEVVSKYIKQINIVYCRFENNLGKVSIVAHWKRCIDLVNNEDWIWLFSDDDIMRADCVASFYESLSDCEGHVDVYRFQSCIIDDNGNSKSNKTIHPEFEDSINFLYRRLNYQTHSYIVDYIFSEKVYKKYNGFVDFEAAWASDDATWILFAQEKGITTIKNGLVYWRESLINISGERKNKWNKKRKFKGTQQFIFWLHEWSKFKGLNIDTKLLQRWYFSMLELIGIKYPIMTYLSSKTFWFYFVKHNFFYQMKYLLIIKMTKIKTRVNNIYKVIKFK